MIKKDIQFGYNIYGKTIGEMWISLIEAILKKGEVSYDEKRKRIALMNVRVKSESQNIKDKIIDKYAENEKTKAMIVFPTYEDYSKIFEDHYINDYLPCIICIQFRLINKNGGFVLNTTFYARSIDAFQKSHGNFLSIAKLSEYVASEIETNLKKKIKVGFLDGIIADAHIYEQYLELAKESLKEYKKLRALPSPTLK